MSLVKTMLFSAMPGLSLKVMRGELPLTPTKTVAGVALLLALTIVMGAVEPLVFSMTIMQLGGFLLTYIMVNGAQPNDPPFPARHFISIAAAAPIPAAISMFIEADLLVLLGLTLFACSTVFNAVALALIPAKPEAAKSRGPVKRPPEMSPAQEVAILRALRATESSQLVQVGPIVGSFQGQEIPAWFIDTEGQTHQFTSVCSRPDMVQLEPGQSIVFPGLIYTLQLSNGSPE